MRPLRLLIMFLLLSGLPILASASASLVDPSEVLQRDLLVIVMSNPVLTVRDLCHCARVSKKLRAAAEDPRTWAKRPPKLRIEVFQLILTHCLRVKALHTQIFVEPLYQLIPERLSFKMQHRLYALMLANKEEVKGEICLTATMADFACYGGFGPEKKITMPPYIAAENPAYIVANYSLPSRVHLEEFLLFAEDFDSAAFRLYLGDLTRVLMESNADDPSEEKEVEKYKAIRRLHNHYVRLGSTGAIELKADFEELMHIEDEPEEKPNL